MFFTPNRVPNKKQELKQQLQTSINKGYSYLQMFQYPQTKTHAISLLQELNQQTLIEIKQQLHSKYQITNVNNDNSFNRCKQYCYEFYYLRKDYLRKKSKKDWALFGIVAFSFVNLLCMFGLWKVGGYFLAKEVQSTETTQNMCGPIDNLLQSTQQQNLLANMSNSWKQTISNYGWPVLNFILGSYALFGLWHCTALLIHCLDTYVHRRKQTKQLKQSMVELREREMQHFFNRQG